MKTRFPSTTKGAGTSSTTDYEQYAYDGNGNRTSFRNRANETIAFTFDTLNRNTAKDLPGIEPDVTYGFDLLGRMTSAAQTGTSLSFTFDALGRNLTQVGPHGTITSTWDLAGRRTRITHPDSNYWDYDYLVTGELSKVRENGATSGVGVLATYNYDTSSNAGQLGIATGITFGNGASTSYAHDAMQRLTTLGHDVTGTTYDQSLGFSYNPASQVTQNTRSNDLYAWNGHYNANRNYTANGLNQYTASGSVTPSYDTKGNLTAAGGATYAYSSQHLLTSASGGISLSYDPFNRLYQTSGGTGGTVRFAYDGLNLVAEYNNSNTLQRRFVHGPGTDNPILWYEGSGTTDRRFLQADERGSVTIVTNGSGSVVGTNAYDEYGIPASTNLGRFQYTGQTWLPELGMYYYKTRIYSPTLGRFLQTDPMRFGAGMNLYNYVHSDPVNFADPLGLKRSKFDFRSYHDGSGGGGSGGGGRYRYSTQPDIVITGWNWWKDLMAHLAIINRADLLRIRPAQGGSNEPDRTKSKKQCEDPTNVMLTGRIITPPVGPASFKGQMTDVATGRTVSVDGLGYAFGPMIGTYSVTATVRGFNALSNGMDIKFWVGPWGFGGASFTDNNGNSIGQGEVDDALAPDNGFGLFSFEPPKTKEKEPGKCEE